ncbi:MAG: DNA gyrase inhibitor YacG [Pseudomonadales bacterium]|nr:DNA gyrase inhibitor YacG [Pseudomonadales bacterium]
MTDLLVDCPTCQAHVKWVDSSVYRPFCSERCKLIDLGAWASGERAIPADPDYDDVTNGELNRD